MSETLGARLAVLDAARFVGRARELACLEQLLDERRGAQVAIVSGPAGIGKSGLIRELTRRARGVGFAPLLLDARDLTPASEALRGALAPAHGERRPLVVLDSWERMGAFDGFLREELLPALPADTRLLIGTRRRPGGEWFARGWENLVLDLPLAPLDAADAEALLLAREVEDEEERADLLDWAGGSPLALVLAADAVALTGGLSRRSPPLALLEEPLRRVLDAQPKGEERDVLAVASLAHVTTPELLAAALPGIDAARAFAWLRTHPSAEPWRNGVMLHDLVARLVRADLHRRAPDFERELRRRLVDSLYARAAESGAVGFARDLQHLVQDPAIRWGFAWDASGRYRMDVPRDGDRAVIAARSGARGRAWLVGAERYFAAAPERVCVVRDHRDTICGYGIGVTPANAPAFALEDPVLGPWLADAAARYPHGEVVLWRQAVDLTPARSSPVIALIGMSAMLDSGLRNPAAVYLPIVADDNAGQAFSHAIGAAAIPSLAVEHGGVRVECHLLDHGPGGLIAFQRAAVYRELGLPAPAPAPELTPAAVREALRCYATQQCPAPMALVPAEGTPAERIAALRARIDAAVAAAFGSSPRERLLRQVLVRAYIEPASTHEQAASELHLSRSAYFRHLRAAVERLSTHLGAVGPIWDAAGTDTPMRRP